MPPKKSKKAESNGAAAAEAAPAAAPATESKAEKKSAGKKKGGGPKLAGTQGTRRSDRSKRTPTSFRPGSSVPSQLSSLIQQVTRGGREADLAGLLTVLFA